ncbi:MAG: Xaa-Pro aminopeptidase, partial [Halobacteriovoraceae bacterium]|nr:Xaa-Pro aminopeptidase [Halobacteriovoraceae bacterium]
MEIHRKRRDRLLKDLQSGIAVISASLPQTRSHDTEHPYRPDSNFFYLTGFEETHALLVLCPNGKEHKTVLFVLPSDKKQETWVGKRLGVDQAQRQLGIDRVYSVNEIDKILPTLFAGHDRVYLDIFGREDYLKKTVDICRKLIGESRRKTVLPTSFMDIMPLIGKMRLIKTSDEIEMVKKGLQVTKDAHLAAMAFCGPGKNEKEVQAILEYVFMKNGGNPPAYGSIV